jgi:hypothetical protein
LTNKQKLFSIALVSAAMILMLTSIAGAAPFAYTTNVSNTSVGNNLITPTITWNDPIHMSVTKEANYSAPPVIPMSITKEANVTNYNAPGQIVQYTYTVVNPAIGSRSLITGVIDNKTGYITMNPTLLNSMESATGTSNYTTTQADVDNGSVVNTADVTAYAYVPGSYPESGTTTFILNAIQTQDLQITTVANVTNYIAPRQNIQYTYTVQNIGNMNITSIGVTDITLNQQISISNSKLVPGQSTTGTYTYTTSQTDVDNGSMVNTAKVTGTLLNGSYVSNTTTFTLNVGQIPTIKWNNPGDIVYGTALGDTQLDATSSVPGSITYNPVTGTILNAGQQQQLTATLTPNDNVKYTMASKNVFINVTKATPTITWNNPSDIVYGTQLTNNQLDATGSVSGQITYNPQAGTILNAGQQQQLTATLTPTDNINYTQASDTVFINITQATPTPAWIPNPLASIISGTALGADLDAKATDPTTGNTVNGNFVYTDETGAVDTEQTVLSVGTHTLTATFTPNDSIDYASGGTVQNSITVAQATPKIVLTPTQQIHQMIDFLEGITTSGELDEGSSIELTAILNAAETNLDRIESNPSEENPYAEPAELRYFITDVKDKIDRGILSQTNGQALIDSANDIINFLRNQSR